MAGPTSSSMIPRFIILFGLSVLGTCLSSALQSPSLRIATLNIWSGLDYRGTASVGEYETNSVREARFEALVDELKEAGADVILLQECNPVNKVGSRLASVLGYDWIGQRVNAGIKIGPLGLPTNLNEGLAILARKDLALEFVDAWRLSSSFGAFGDIVSFHFAEHNIALVGRICVQGRGILLVNVHLPSSLPDDSTTRQAVEAILQNRGDSPVSPGEIRREIRRGAEEREQQVARLLEHLETHAGGMPVILGGDMNATEVSPEVQRLAGRFVHVMPSGEHPVTWDPLNPNTAYSRLLPPQPTLLDELNVWYDGIPRLIDHIFLRRGFRPDDVVSASIFADRPRGGRYVSDHYGLLADVWIGSPADTAAQIVPPSIEVLPILSYDTDVGFGYGAKGFVLNAFGKSESIDLTVFNSTKGERWYRLVFSVPDFELRQGTRYPWSLDVIVDYDKYLVSNFFGLGSESRKSDRETYTKEPLEAQLLVGRGWSGELVTHMGMKFKTVRNEGFPSGGFFATTTPVINQGRSSGWSLLASVRNDTRDSYINPSRGHVVQLDLEHGIGGDYRASSLSLALQGYKTLFYPKTVLAARIMGQAVGGANLPLHALASLGGNKTLRGYAQDRFLGKALLLGNLEVRFPIFWRLHGLALYDVGQVRGTVGQITMGRGWRSNTGFGLRLLMDTFVVRLDVGWSGEGTGLYFNFGHLF
ncbi:MAG: BamA/TamA family outer membrane protein [Ignavibacterium sp.]